MKPFEPGVPSVLVTLRVSAALDRRITAEAKRRGCKRSALLRDLIEFALAHKRIPQASKARKDGAA